MSIYLIIILLQVYECDATDVDAGVMGVFVEGFLNQSIEGKPLKS